MPNHPGAPEPSGTPLIAYWKLVVLERYAKFEGRAGRAEFWWFFLANLIIDVVLSILDRVSLLFAIISICYSLGVLIPSIAVGIRRLHDTNRSGWWLLIGLVPFVGAIVLIVFFALESAPGTNQWGPSEKAAVA